MMYRLHWSLVKNITVRTVDSSSLEKHIHFQLLQSGIEEQVILEQIGRSPTPVPLHIQEVKLFKLTLEDEDTRP